MRLLGITGHAGAGKDYTFERLMDELPELLWANLKFAHNLKTDIEATLGADMFIEFNQGDEIMAYTPAMPRLPALWQKPYAPEIRKLLQWWGTELRREENEDYWLMKMGQQVHSYLYDAFTVPVITDVRFPNEAEFIHDWGGHIIGVDARIQIRAERLGLANAEYYDLMGHNSEKHIDGIERDFTVTSNDPESWEESGILEYMKREYLSVV